jgi:hypothetical protein
MKIPEWVWLIVALGVAIGIIESVRGCAGPTTIVRDRIVRVPMTPPPVIGTASDRPVVVRMLPGRVMTDTAEIARLRDTIKDMHDRLRTYGASLAWGVDTVTAAGDTVTIECRTPDAVTWNIRPATRLHDVIVRDTIPLVTSRSRWGLGITLGAVATTDGIMRPGVGVGVCYQLLP